jgi:hypothetical protein
MLHRRPDYFDGIVAGDPVYDLEAIALTEDWGVKAIEAITPFRCIKPHSRSIGCRPSLPLPATRHASVSWNSSPPPTRNPQGALF